MSKLLSQAEVDALPDGTIVEIIWHGGNGPHRYQVMHRDGISYAKLPDGHPYENEFRWSSGFAITYVSKTSDQRRTWVRLPGPADTWPHRTMTWRSDGITSCPACGGECKFADHEHNRRFTSPRPQQAKEEP